MVLLDHFGTWPYPRLEGFHKLQKGDALTYDFQKHTLSGRRSKTESLIFENDNDAVITTDNRNLIKQIIRLLSFARGLGVRVVKDNETEIVVEIV